MMHLLDHLEALIRSTPPKSPVPVERPTLTALIDVASAVEFVLTKPEREDRLEILKMAFAKLKGKI